MERVSCSSVLITQAAGIGAYPFDESRRALVRATCYPGS